MSKYKNLNAIIMLFSLVFFTTSCSDFLDSQPVGVIAEKDAFNNATYLRNYVNEVYNGMIPPYQYGVAEGQWAKGTGGFVALTDLAVRQPATHGNATGINIYLQGLMSPDNVSQITQMWSNEYRYIRKVNIFFKKIKNSTIPPSKLKRLKGEMHFLRAWMYFSLSRIYGGVPIITEVFSLNTKSYSRERNTYEEVVQFVVKECNKAAKLLDGLDTKPGQIGKAAALALKARMRLYAASPLHNLTSDRSKWIAAKKATEAVLNLDFELHPTYPDLFMEPIKTDGIILARSYTVSNGIEPWALNYNYWPSGFDSRQELMPTQRFVNMFQMTNGEYPYLWNDGELTVNPGSGYNPQHPFKNRDPRFYASILFPGAGPVHIIDGAKTTHRLYEYWEDAHPNIPKENPNKFDPENGQKLYDFGRDSKSYWEKGLTPFFYEVNTGYAFRKLMDFKAPRAVPNADYNVVTVWFRLAEFYLNYAEIMIHLGKDAIARKYINKVRGRVDMPPITASGKKLVKVYRRERAVELNLENHRFFDLMRWKAAPGHVDINPIRGITKSVMDWSTAKGPGDLMGTLHFTYGVIESIKPRASWPGDYYYLFPIPSKEIKRSGGTLKQNPGY